MQTVPLLNIWTGIRSNLIAKHLIWYELKEETKKLNKNLIVHTGSKK